MARDTSSYVGTGALGLCVLIYFGSLADSVWNTSARVLRDFALHQYGWHLDADSIAVALLLFPLFLAVLFPKTALQIPRILGEMTGRLLRFSRQITVDKPSAF